MSLAAIGEIWLRLFLYPKIYENSNIQVVGCSSQSSESSKLYQQRRVHKLFTTSAKQEMKPSTAFCVILAIAIGTQLISAHIKNNQVAPSKHETEEFFCAENSDENRPISGMNFNVKYVTEEYEYDDKFCLVYDDPDANMFESPIFVDRYTYQSAIAAIKSGEEMCGTLITNDSLSTKSVEIFTFTFN